MAIDIVGRYIHTADITVIDKNLDFINLLQIEMKPAVICFVNHTLIPSFQINMCFRVILVSLMCLRICPPCHFLFRYKAWHGKAGVHGTLHTFAFFPRLQNVLLCEDEINVELAHKNTPPLTLLTPWILNNR